MTSYRAPESSPRVRLVRVEYRESGRETLWVAFPYAVSATHHGGQRVDELHELFCAETKKRKELLESPTGAEDPLVEEPILTPFERSRGGPTAGTRPEPADEAEPRGFARSGKIKQPTRFR